MDYKRNITRQFAIVKTTANSTRFQLFRIFPLIELTRGTGEQQRLGPLITLQSIEFTIHITCDFLCNHISKVENVPVSFSAGSHIVSSSLTLEHPTYDESFSGFAGLITGVTVPIDGQAFAQELSATNYVPAFNTNILSANGDNITTNGQCFYKNGNVVFPFSVPRLWQIKNEIIVRILVIKCNYIFDTAMVNGDLFFNTRNTQMNPYNGLNGGTNIPVGSFMKNEFYPIIEIVWEKIFNIGSRKDLFYRLRIPNVYGTKCAYRENARSPTFNNFNITPRTFIEPLENNYYVMLMSNPTYGCTNFTDIYSEPTYGQVQVNWSLDINSELIYKDISITQ